MCYHASAQSKQTTIKLSCSNPTNKNQSQRLNLHRLSFHPRLSSTTTATGVSKSGRIHTIAIAVTLVAMRICSGLRQRTDRFPKVHPDRTFGLGTALTTITPSTNCARLAHNFSCDHCFLFQIRIETIPPPTTAPECLSRFVADSCPMKNQPPGRKAGRA